jgi:hypothetical protein
MSLHSNDPWTTRPITSRHAGCRATSRIEQIVASHDHAGTVSRKGAATDPAIQASYKVRAAGWRHRNVIVSALWLHLHVHHVVDGG